MMKRSFDVDDSDSLDVFPDPFCENTGAANHNNPQTTAGIRTTMRFMPFSCL
jgi:hypothetical protein